MPRPAAIALLAALLPLSACGDDVRGCLAGGLCQLECGDDCAPACEAVDDCRARCEDRCDYVCVSSANCGVVTCGADCPDG